MFGLFGRKKTERDEHVTALEQQARAGEIALVDRIAALNSRRELLTQLNNLDRVSEDALKDLGGHRRA